MSSSSGNQPSGFLSIFHKIVPNVLKELSVLLVRTDREISLHAKVALREICSVPEFRDLIDNKHSMYGLLVKSRDDVVATESVAREKIRENKLAEVKLDGDYAQWICDLASTLCKWCSCSLLRVMEKIFSKQQSLVKLLLPYVFLDLALDRYLTEDDTQWISGIVFHHLSSWIIEKEESKVLSVKLLIHCLEFLRNFYTDWKLGKCGISSDGISTPKRWPTVYWLDIKYSLVCASAILVKKPATALLYMEHWCHQEYGVLKLHEFEFTAGSGVFFERLLVKIFKELADQDTIRVAVNDLCIKNVLVEMATSGEEESKQGRISIGSLLEQQDTLMQEVSSWDLWKKEYEDLDKVWGSWTPCHHQYEMETDVVEMNLTTKIAQLEGSLTRRVEEFPECIRQLLCHRDSTFFLDSMLEAKGILHAADSSGKSEVWEKWSGRYTFLQEEGRLGTLQDLLDLHLGLLDTLRWEDHYLELLLRKIRVLRKQEDYHAAEKTIEIVESSPITSHPSPVKKFQGVSNLLHIERGKLLWNQGDATSATLFAKFFIKKIKERSRLDSFSFDSFEKIDGEISKQQVFDASVLCRWLCLLSKWLFTSQLESSEQILLLMGSTETIIGLKDFKDSQEYIEIVKKCHYRFACYADHDSENLRALSDSMEHRINSPAFKAKEEEVRLLSDQLQTEGPSSHESQELDKHRRQVKAAIVADHDRAKVLKEKTIQSFLIAIKHYSETLKMTEKYDLEIVFRLCQLWFAFQDSQEVNPEIEKCFEDKNIPSSKLLPVFDQVVSRLSLQSDQHDFLRINRRLVKRLTQDHPYHTLLKIICLRNGNEREKRRRQTERVIRARVDIDKVEAAQKLLMELTNESPKLRTVINQLEKLVKCYTSIASLPRPGDPTRSTVLIPTWIVGQTRELDSIPVLSSSLPVQSSGDYRFASFHSFGEKIEFKGGSHLAKVIQVEDSNGVKFKEVVKSGDDLHQDAILQEVFNITNHLLEQKVETRKRNLKIQTYKVVPLSSIDGLVQWVDNTIQLSEYLIGPDKHSGAHFRYKTRKGYDFETCYKKMKGCPASDSKKVYKEVCSRFLPVMHHFFLENNRCALDWYKMKLSFTRSTAVSSIIGFIVGLGDRHLDNILIRQDTAEIVHIDLGVAFGQGLFLPTPECVPFRLTPDIIDGMGIHGVKGTMMTCCQETLKVLKENRDCLEMIFDLFVHDPLSTWTATCLPTPTQLSPSENEDQERRRLPEARGNFNAERVVSEIREKLKGVSGMGILSIEGQVEKLIRDAQDPEKLCEMYCDWAPWL